jgi:diguanylate cyclase (GGDEF)-like protein/PAS domain S-box-containing protein
MNLDAANGLIKGKEPLISSLPEKLRLLTLAANGTGQIILVLDHKERIAFANRRFTEVFGFSVEESLGRYPMELLSGKNTAAKTIARLQRGASRNRIHSEEVIAYSKAGEEIWISVSVEVIRDAGNKVTNLVSVIANITETRHIQSLQNLVLEQLANDDPVDRIIDNLCRKVEQIAPDVIASVLHVDGEGRLHPLGGPSLPKEYSMGLEGLMIGPAAGSCGTAAFRGEPVLVTDIAHDPLWNLYKEWPIRLGLVTCWSTPIRGREGRVIGAFAFYYRDCREPSRWHANIVDACVHLCALAVERHEARAKVARLAYFDAVTGLPNRTQLRAEIDAVISGSEPAAVLFIDLDGFKSVNDTFGHAMGDQLLALVAHLLKRNIRPGDIIGRHGGDEFVAVLPRCTAVQAAEVATGLISALSEAFLVGDQWLTVSASIGISLCLAGRSDGSIALQQADVAMYGAKRAGGSAFRFFTAVLTEPAAAGRSFQGTNDEPFAAQER